MNIRLAAGPRHHLALDSQRVQEVIHTLRGIIGIETLAKFGVLRRDTYRTTPCVAVITVTGLYTDFFLEIGLRDILVAVKSHHR